MTTVRRFADAARFRDAVSDFLVAREARHSLFLGISGDIADPSAPYRDPYLACAEHDGGVVGCALRTPPRQVIMSEATGDAVDAIVDDLFEHDPAQVGVVGAKPVAARFVERWTALAGGNASVHMSQRGFQLERVRPPDGVPGALRDATGDDRDLLRAYLSGFTSEAEGEGVPDPASLDRSLGFYLTSPSRGLVLWDVDGRAVSMAGFMGPTPNGIRIGAVYTPPEMRGHGYASACVAALSQRLLDEGRRYCFLFTDLANPTSNAIYRKIGYEPTHDVDAYRFAPAGVARDGDVR